MNGIFHWVGVNLWSLLLGFNLHHQPKKSKDWSALSINLDWYRILWLLSFAIDLWTSNAQLPGQDSWESHEYSCSWWMVRQESPQVQFPFNPAAPEKSVFRWPYPAALDLLQGWTVESSRGCPPIEWGICVVCPVVVLFANRSIDLRFIDVVPREWNRQVYKKKSVQSEQD